MRVELPNGEVAEFPDGMAPEAIENALRGQFGKPSGPVPGVDFQLSDASTPYEKWKRDDLPGIPQRADDVARFGARGATLGFIDYLSGKLPGGAGSPEAERQKTIEARNRLGDGTARAVETGGALAGVGGILGRLPALVSTLGRSVTTGGAIGGLDVTGHSVSDRGELPEAGELATGVATGIAGAAIGYGVGSYADKIVRKWTGAGLPAEAAATAKQEGDALYKAADSAGVSIRPSSFRQFARDVRKDMEGKFLDADTAPGVDRALKVLDRAAATNKPLSLRELDEIRQTVRDILPNNASANEGRLIRNMVGHIDAYAQNLPNMPAAVLGGDTKQGIAALNAGRERWSAAMRGEQYADAWDQALLTVEQGKKSMHRAVQDEFGKLYRQLKKDPAGWSKEHVAAIRDIAAGEGLASNLNKLDRMVGQSAFRPFINVLTGGLRSGASAGAATKAIDFSQKIAGSPSRLAVTPLLQQQGTAFGILGPIYGRK